MDGNVVVVMWLEAYSTVKCGGVCGGGGGRWCGGWQCLFVSCGAEAA